MDRGASWVQSIGSQRVRHDLVIEHNLITVHVSLIEPFSSSSMLVSSQHLLCWFQSRGERQVLFGELSVNSTGFSTVLSRIETCNLIRSF